MRLQLFAARSGLGLTMLAYAAAAASLGGVRLGLISYSTGFVVMGLAAGAGLAALLCAVCWAVMAFRRNRGEGKRMGAIALAGSLLLLWPPAHTLYMGFTSPAIHDAATSPEDPPQFVALARARRPGMNSPVYDGNEKIHFHGETNTANYMLHTYYYYTGLTRPKVYLMWTKPKLFWHAFETAKKQGWQIVDYSEKDGRIEATDKSFWFGQTADIVIRVREAGPQGARLDARSENETGARDDGENITRLENFLNAL